MTARSSADGWFPSLCRDAGAIPWSSRATRASTPTTAEGLAKLAPQSPDGVVTFGTQTHPADGTAGMLDLAVQICT